MNRSRPHTEHHPRWYRVRVSTWWWMWQWRYLKFILRELSSLAVAWTVALTLAQLYYLGEGAALYAAFQEWLRHPVVLGMNVVAFGFVIFHAITWFNLAPRAMAVRLRGKRVPDVLVAAPNYVVWLAASGFVAWVLLG